jgi:hypothetical protein
VRLPIKGPPRSFALVESVTVEEAAVACAALAATDYIGEEEASAVRAMLKPEILQLL